MIRAAMNINRMLSTAAFLLAWSLLAAVLSGCAAIQPPPDKVQKPAIEEPEASSFVAVTAGKGDTLESLAGKYLGDPSKGWLIGEFNEIDTVSPGQVLVIPLRPFNVGGLEAKRYQVVPVLSYHQFSKKKKDKMTVTEADFEAQMAYLKENGYHVITMDALFDFLDFKAQIPKKSVVITIDDGWLSTYDIAFPILKKYNYPATLFIYTNLITGSKKTLNWDQIREMSQNGIDMQCHTVTHRYLTKVDEKETFVQFFDAVNREITKSTMIIEEKLGKKPKYLAYPYGETNKLVIALLRKHGYRGAFTVNRGSSPFFFSNYRINRSMIFGDLPLKRFEKNLATVNAEAFK